MAKNDDCSEVGDLNPDSEILYSKCYEAHGYSINRVHTRSCRVVASIDDDRLIQTTVDRTDLDSETQICLFCSHHNDRHFGSSHHVDIAALAARPDVQTFDQLMTLVEKMQEEGL
jgi:hypothetical protein